MNNKKSKVNTLETFASEKEVAAYECLVSLFHNCPIGDKEILANLSLFLTRSSMSRILFMHHLYQKIIHTHGIIVEFGTRWGHNLSLFTIFRNIYEPYNISRKIVAFDTFEGFPNVTSHDGNAEIAQVGELSVTPGYEKYLDKILQAQEYTAPRSNIKKYELVKGDVIETLPCYLEKHPETIIALAYFDLDLYEPTKKSLETIRPYLVKNSIIGFDELCLDKFPGETLALRELQDLFNCKIYREPYSINQSYLINQ